jgi:hypothetical protein
MGPKRRVHLGTPPPPPAAREGVHTHDGFYLRFATGFGVYEERLESDDTALYGGEVSGRTIGIASLGEFAMGGTVSRGLVLGGGFYTAQLLAGSFKPDGSSAGIPPAELDPDFRELLVVGPFLDWYPRPSRGLHFQVAVGFAGITAGTNGNLGDDDEDAYVAVGGGIVLGAGYEWWIADDWSLGVMARAQAAALSAEDDADVRWFHGVSTGPSLMLTLTYH